MGKKRVCGNVGFCRLLVWQKIKCANPNTIANPNINPITNTNPNLIPNPTSSKLQPASPQARILPFACPIDTADELKQTFFKNEIK